MRRRARQTLRGLFTREEPIQNQPSQGSLSQVFRKIEFPALEASIEIISPRSNSRNDSHPFEAAPLRNRFCLFKQARSQPGMLRGALFFRADWKRLSIHMHFPD